MRHFYFLNSKIFRGGADPTPFVSPQLATPIPSLANTSGSATACVRTYLDAIDELIEAGV